MLEITIPGFEYYDEEKNSFETLKPLSLKLEHSLISLSKWESKWKVPFNSKEQKTNEQLQDYIRCMSFSEISIEDVRRFPKEVVQKISDYIESTESATTITNRGPQKRNNEIMTSELIYYYMIACQIPFSCEKWHINRLLNLIQICSIKNNPKGKKMSKGEILRNQHAINAQRLASMKTSG